MSEIRSFRDLEVWQLAMQLTAECYELTKTLPPDERYGLSSQIRRSAVSVPANIAEGHRRRGRTYRHHVEIALGSHAELETEIELAVRLNLISPTVAIAVAEKATRVGQMLHGLRRSLRRQATDESEDC